MNLPSIRDDNGKPRACAECRRLKLRCDRKFPCQACVRRGCSAICPDKCFTDNAAPSSLKANTLRSREKIRTLEARIAVLERALAQENPSHPLLSAENGPYSLETAKGTEETFDKVTDILGDLSISEDGSTVFHGVATCSEHIVIQDSLNHPGPRLLGDTRLNLPHNLQLLSALFPFTPVSVVAAANVEDFLPFLPSAEEASRLTKLYWKYYCLNSPMSETQYMKHVYDVFYPGNKMKPHLVCTDAHRLGLLFITLALGVIVDMNKLTLSSEAERYHQLSRAAMSLDPVCDNTTVPALQCMVSIDWYIKTAPTRSSRRYDWVLNGVTLKLASSIGIFRDSRKWLKDPDEIQQREMLCWELISLEVWMAFTNGWPSSVDLSLVDCPQPSDASVTSPGSIPGYHHWKYNFCTLIHRMLLVLLRPKQAVYSEILALERQLRECVMPPALEIPLHGSPLEDVPEDAITPQVQRFMALLLRETTSCMLHRRFLVLALESGLSGPQDAPFRYSVLRAGNSARWIITSQIIMYRRYPVLLSRVPVCWSVTFSAAIILGAICAHYTDREFAQCTLVPFESIFALFAETFETSIQPPHALESLKRLHKRVMARMHPSSAQKAPTPIHDQHFPIFPAQQPSATTSFNPEADKDVTTVELFSGNIRTSIVGFPTESNEVLDPTAAAWPAFDPTYPSDGVDPSTGNYTWPSQWPEGNMPYLDTSTVQPSTTEVEQWDQFLDNLGVRN